MAATKKTAAKQMTFNQKIQEARDTIKAFPVKKAGRNTFSKYDYFTPEQINLMVTEACKKVGLITFYSLNRDQYGLDATLVVEEIDGEESKIFTMAMDVPVIKATNVAQQLGGAMTYSKRYLEMAAFDIVENSLDFDTTENTKSTVAPVTKRAADSKPPRAHKSKVEDKVAPKPAVPSSAKKEAQNGKVMNAATAKYFEEKLGTIPIAKLREALLTYDTSGGYGMIVDTMLDDEVKRTKTAKK